MPSRGNLFNIMCLDGGEVLSSMVLSQPSWTQVNEGQSFIYTREDVEEMVGSHNPGIEFYNEEDLGKEFYSHHDEPSLNFVSSK